jgi:hypothetical protein
MLKMPPGPGHNSRGSGAFPGGNGAGGPPIVANPTAEPAAAPAS